MIRIYSSADLNANTLPASMLLTREAEIVNSFMKLVKTNFMTMKQVSDYAKQLYISANYLNRLIKKNTGYTASYHIQQQIVLEAKKQVKTAGASLKQVAYSLGYDDLSHFSKFFKNNCGMNFTEFKKGISRSFAV